MFTPVSNKPAKLFEIEPVYNKADVIIVLSGGAYSDGTLTTNLFKMGFAGKLIIVGSTINSPTKKL